MTDDKRNRSAVTGEYVSDEEAATHPRTTVAEKVVRPVPVANIGRPVHYVSYGTPGGEFTSECRAAFITEIDPERGGLVGLCVLNPSGLFFDQDITYSEEKKGGTWHRPEHA